MPASAPAPHAPPKATTAPTTTAAATSGRPARRRADTSATPTAEHTPEQVPGLLAAATAEADTLEDRIRAAQQVLAELRATHTAVAFLLIEGNDEFAAAQVVAARSAIMQGHAALMSRRTRARAGANVDAAQAALDQATRLIAAVEDVAAQLVEATGLLAKAAASMQADITDARRLALLIQADPATTRAVEAEARAALAAAQADRVGDPLAVLARLTTAEAALDRVLAAARSQPENNARAAALLREVTSRVEAQIAAVSAYQETRPTDAGAQSALAEAAAHVTTARRLALSDVHEALDAAQQGERAIARAIMR
jgi:hypothetical protein